MLTLTAPWIVQCDDTEGGDNTCNYAHDGQCDEEERRGTGYCEAGTDKRDCDDCEEFRAEQGLESDCQAFQNYEQRHPPDAWQILLTFVVLILCCCYPCIVFVIAWFTCIRQKKLGKGLLSRFCATIREIRDFNREIFGTNRESVCILDGRQPTQNAWAICMSVMIFVVYFLPMFTPLFFAYCFGPCLMCVVLSVISPSTFAAGPARTRLFAPYFAKAMCVRNIASA
eukprot:SAG31_NODE_364_length_16841_cov_7.005256_3_plen_227_part_00